MELIEREQQSQKLVDAWQQVETGTGCIALVSGEAGIGKTSLIDRFAHQVGGEHVLWGACDDLFSPQPLGPFIDIAIQIRTGLLERIQAGHDRLAISTEFLIYLQNRPSPAIVVLEDLHWADEATLDVVKFVGRRIRHTRALLVLSYRDDEINSKHPLSFLLGDFPAQFCLRIALPPLSEQAVNELARQARQPLAGLYAITGGNPFFVTEVLDNDGKGIPASVRDAVLARVARLSPAAVRIVEVASLIPGAAEIGLIESILQPEAALLDECVDKGILRAAENTLAFRHELARQSVEDSLPIGRSRALHRQILAVLLGRESEPGVLARLVHHATRAGDEAATLHFAPMAARQASALGAHREAAVLYRTSLHYTHLLTPAAHAELLDGLSFECYLTGQIDEAIEARQQATAIWQRLADDQRAGEGKRWLSRLCWTGGRRQEAETYADEAVAILLARPPGQALAIALSNKSQLHMLADEVEPTREWGNRAIALARRIGATETLVHALTNVGTAELQSDHDAGLEKLETALRLSREQEMHDHVARCYTNLVSMYVRMRRYPVARRWLEEGLAYTTARDLDLYSVYLRGWLARLYLETGAWAEAEETARKALRRSHGSSVIPMPAILALSHLKVRQGDAEAHDLLAQASALTLPTAELQRLGPLAVARAEVAWWQGHREQVVAEAAAAYELALSRHDAWILGQLAYWLWRADGRQVPLHRVPLPYALMIQGEWRAAGVAWERLGCPFEQAMALAENDGPAKEQALAIFEQLGAESAAVPLRAQLRAQGVGEIPAQPGLRRQNHLDELTPRELEVLQLIAAGLSNPAVAAKLTISVGTVKAHTNSIYSKLGVNNRVQAVRRARDLRLW